jgi:cytosine/adenosine deaminase-related metal-dependent hydrolase
MTPTTLLRGGTVLVHDNNDHVQPTKADVLIRGNTIAAIAAKIEVDASTTVIDCTEKIISPGFVDTHHHVWHTQLKGRHANQLLLEYIYTGYATHRSRSQRLMEVDREFTILKLLTEGCLLGRTWWMFGDARCWHNYSCGFRAHELFT